jgi:hypothetical protein
VIRSGSIAATITSSLPLSFEAGAIPLFLEPEKSKHRYIDTVPLSAEGSKDRKLHYLSSFGWSLVGVGVVVLVVYCLWFDPIPAGSGISPHRTYSCS